MCNMRGSTGEIGLKVGGAENYFGLIYIGDTCAFKKLVEADDSGIVLEEDAIAGSLFDSINEPNTWINVLIGAKKFMEGWNSWRVSNMGLLNIGRSEGAEIIQLFGRGVRLMGLDRSLKRSSAIDGNHPEHIRLLERLNFRCVGKLYGPVPRVSGKRRRRDRGTYRIAIGHKTKQELFGKRTHCAEGSRRPQFCG